MQILSTILVPIVGGAVPVCIGPQAFTIPASAQGSNPQRRRQCNRPFGM